MEVTFNSAIKSDYDEARAQVQRKLAKFPTDLRYAFALVALDRCESNGFSLSSFGDVCVLQWPYQTTTSALRLGFEYQSMGMTIHLDQDSAKVSIGGSGKANYTGDIADPATLESIANWFISR